MNVTFSTGQNEGNNPSPGQEQPQNNDIIQKFVSSTLAALGLNSTTPESKLALENGSKVIAGAVIIPQTFNLPSWITPTCSLLGLGIAVAPTVKGYFTSTSQVTPLAITIPSTPAEELKVPDIKFSKSTKPTTLNYSQESNPSTINPTSHSENEDSLQEILLELASLGPNIGSTPLYQELTAQESTLNNSQKLEKIRIANDSIGQALKEATKYIEFLGPILLIKNKLSSITEKTDAALKAISENNEINKILIKKLVSDVTESISSLQNSLDSLDQPIQLIVPAIDYDKLKLEKTKEFIRQNSLDDRIIGQGNLLKLKETYKTALDAIEHLCNLKDLIDENLNASPTSFNLKSATEALALMSTDIENLSRLENPPISIEWLKEKTKEYTLVTLDYLTQAITQTTTELNKVIDFSKDTKTPEERLTFIKTLRETINKPSITDSVKQELKILDENIANLEKAIETKKSWQPTKNKILTGLGALGVTAAITATRLFSDVAIAYFQKA